MGHEDVLVEQEERIISEMEYLHDDDQTQSDKIIQWFADVISEIGIAAIIYYVYYTFVNI